MFYSCYESFTIIYKEIIDYESKFTPKSKQNKWILAFNIFIILNIIFNIQKLLKNFIILKDEI